MEDDRNEERLDPQRVEEARWRIATGYYDLPEVLEEAAERLARTLRNAE